MIKEELHWRAPDGGLTQSVYKITYSDFTDMIEAWLKANVNLDDTQVERVRATIESGMRSDGSFEPYLQVEIKFKHQAPKEDPTVRGYGEIIG